MIDELVRIGILLDLSHAGVNTTKSAMDYMDENYPGIPYICHHSLPIDLCKDEPDALPLGCNRNITYE